ncbi:glycosyltransferase [Marichromatium gracile]|uniref:Glycosyl transferase family 2 n=1 Tax=Marichromatium gracile TaxID=1048 RepID=A0ABR5VG23_MARGR|nr:glycosyltransferase [Marichromatium gracile]KXX63332.1 glycosyl transferase family 2 [Marichromatium gracile]
MDASIIVCTYNRADSLAETLDALAALRTPPGCDWEVVVVDNNSSDHTAALLRERAAGWSRLRAVSEPRQGLSHARNQGIASARGEVLLFTDDDVLPEPDWLEQVLDGLERERADACGGYIAPIWERPPPPWLSARFHGFLAVRMDERGPFVFTPGDSPPYGANMAFRRTVFERVGGFDVNRGRKGAVLASGEDGELFERVLAAGMRVVWLPRARVHHKVEAFRLERRYFRRWRYQNSRNLAQARGLPGRRRLLGVPLYVLPQLARAVGRWLLALATAPADETFRREILIHHFLGTIHGLYDTRARGHD